MRIAGRCRQQVLLYFFFFWFFSPWSPFCCCELHGPYCTEKDITASSPPCKRASPEINFTRIAPTNTASRPAEGKGAISAGTGIDMFGEQ